jgi:hypothetical protein
MEKGDSKVTLNDSDDDSYSSGSSIDDGIDEAQQRVGLTTTSSQSTTGAIPTDRRAMLTKTLSQAAMAVPEELCDIPDDVYSMFFLSENGGPAFWYPVYVTALKMALYTFLIIDAIDQPIPDELQRKVLLAQFLMLPIAVAIQEDLTAFFFTVANVEYSTQIQAVFPNATMQKFNAANLFRGLDGFYSLLVNFVILLKAETVLSLFLNFAALQFLQTIDNIALHLCIDGYLFEGLEQIAHQVTRVKLPRKKDSIFNVLDSVFFIVCYIGILIAWIVVQNENLFNR